MVEKLRKINRALLELCLGIVFVGVLCQLIGMWFAPSKLLYTAALWLGILLAFITAVHMYRTLDRALDFGADATKMVTKANLLRYGCILIIFGIVIMSEVLNPLITFMGLMSLKVAAYLQPFTHKLTNKFFHEVDPIPQPLPEEEVQNAEENENRI
jgi:heme O synthase-like polyprenyltransferase